MTVNDIDYEDYQELKRKADAFDKEVHNNAKFIQYGYRGFIRTDEIALIHEFKTITDCKEYWGSAIQAYCYEKNIQFSEFVTKYGIKK